MGCVFFFYVSTRNNLKFQEALPSKVVKKKLAKENYNSQINKRSRVRNHLLTLICGDLKWLNYFRVYREYCFKFTQLEAVNRKFSQNSKYSLQKRGVKTTRSIVGLLLSENPKTKGASKL